MPKAGPLFPYLCTDRAGDRATEFKQRCVGLSITAVSLHSYRYAWAERARVAGMPERFAQEALGHNSKAIHRAYARKAQVKVPASAFTRKPWTTEKSLAWFFSRTRRSQSQARERILDDLFILRRSLELIRLPWKGKSFSGGDHSSPTLDPDDEMVLELAVACAAMHLITFNKRDFAGAERFGISVLTPEAFLAELRT